MASELRLILNHIAASQLRILCEARGLPTGGDQHEKRERLARSFRGKVEELLPFLTRAEMIDVLESFYYFDVAEPDFRGHLRGLGRANRAEMGEVMIKVFQDGWGPTRQRPHPLGTQSVVRFVPDDEDTAAEPDDDKDDDDDGDEILEAGHPDSDAANDGAMTDEDSLSASFLNWLESHLAQRPRTNLLVKTLVNRLGHFTADQRLTRRAVQALARTLATGGFVTEPDLGSMERSPGIDARVTVSRSAGIRQDVAGSETWTPVPEPPSPRQSGSGPVNSSSLAGSTPGGPITGFERAALKLQFLVLVAAAIRRPDEGNRRLAVELAARGLPLQAADHIRLRALAHQYATGHGDLNQVVPRLRAMLGDVERIQLLEDIRALAPATPELGELVAVYATDLAVSAVAAPPASAPLPSVPAPTSEPSPKAAAVPIAGGVRANAALDALFAKESTS